MPYDNALEKINALEGEIHNEVQHHHKAGGSEKSITVEMTQLVAAEKDYREMTQALMEKAKQPGADHAALDKELDDAEAELLMTHARVSRNSLPCLNVLTLVDRSEHLRRKIARSLKHSRLKQARSKPIVRSSKRCGRRLMSNRRR